MNLPAFLFALRWLMWDTVRLAMASGLFWVMIAVTVLCTVFCLSLGVEGDIPLQRNGDPAAFLPNEKLDEKGTATRDGVDIIQGKVSIAFGAIQVPIARDRESFVKYVQLLMAGWIADAAGILLALVWTAGFLPSFLEPSAAAVLIAKPMPRWGLLLGKYLGVVAFVLFQATLFVGLTWLAMALKLGVWDLRYLACIPLLVLHFAMFFSFSVFVAVCTRSTVASVIGSILFWLMCWGMNFGRHAFFLEPQLQEAGTGAMGFLVEMCYWVTPKPADMGLVLFDVMAGDGYFGRVLDVQKLDAAGGFHPELSILTSMLATVGILGLAAVQFRNTDY